MEKITKKYLNRLIYGREWVAEEVDFQDPEKVDTTDITQFCFFERSYIIDGDEVYTGQSKITSPVYHVGKRYSILEILEICTEADKPYFQQVYQRNNNASICISDFGRWELMDEDGITLEEYINNKNKKKIS